MSFKENDMVKVTAPLHSLYGESGKIILVFADKKSFVVKFDSGRESAFFINELELVDPKREALIKLAETLDSARKQANNLNGMDGTVYQSITTPLISVLDALVPFENVGYDAYEFLIEDGLSVREALKKVGK